MTRLIDANALDNALTKLRFNADGELAHWGDRKDWCLHGSEVEKLIADAPTVDAVEVVRCKDCKKRNAILWCERSHLAVEDDDFCSRGERREDAETD